MVNKKQFLIILLILFMGTLLYANDIRVINVEGVINPASASYIQENIERAEEANDECLIIQLDTPGGLMNSMRDIIKKILNSNVPVIVYVSPSGARAASAGVFITVSAHVSAMAPGTNIGAAHPVQMGGMPGSQPDSVTKKTMMDKATNDAVAYIRSLAEERDKNADWLEKSVRRSVSITAQEALDSNVVDLVASDMDSLLAILDGRELELKRGLVVLETKDKNIVTHQMGFYRNILDIISNPNVSYLLMMLGFLGVMFEIRNPGAIIPGVVGAIALILAFYSFQILPINYTGLALIIAAIVLFILEIHIVSFGFLTLGGIALMIFGSMMLIDTTEAPAELFSISLGVIIPVAILTAGFIVFAFSMVMKTLKTQVTTGTEGMAGLEGEAISDITEAGGQVIVHGEVWNAESNSEIKEGDKITVEKREGMKVIVNKKEE
ncbi:MAG: nodulation protein NfeD [Candidatus Marinimicrobia bacterium]|nr:nodulation protein NfeD [Candidatus Neomarinimicrobiota bacterium]